MTYCNKCHQDSCGCGCKPAQYGCDFDIFVDPYNSEYLNIVINGALKKVKMPTALETDTKLSINSDTKVLNYSAEKHQDAFTGAQLGELFSLGDLYDVDFNKDLAGHCQELIYRKYGDCGEGCAAPTDAWSSFNVNSEGAKKDYLRYVRGANQYGCPVYLDIPNNVDQYWFAGWRTDGEHKEFGYYQATPEEQLPEGASILYTDGDNKSVHAAPMVTASHNLYQSYHRGNDILGGDYYYATGSSYDLHLAPDSVHGMVVGASGASSDPTCSNLNQDAIAIVHWCSDQTGSGGSNHIVLQMTPYHSGEVWTQDMEDQRAIHMEAAVNTAMPSSTSLKIPKGSHLVLHVTGDPENIGQFRVHQFSVTWIPANLLSSVSEIIQ